MVCLYMVIIIVLYLNSRGLIALRAHLVKKLLNSYSLSQEPKVSLTGYQWTGEEEFLTSEELFYTH